MKRFGVHFVVIMAAFGLVAGALSFGARSSRGQSQTPKVESPVKPAVLITDRPTSATTTTSPFTDAASKNAVLRNELTWTFGGKQQRGWYLYDLLLNQTLDNNSSSDSVDFASAVSAWQTGKLLNSTGVLDEESLMAIVAQWQSNRLKDRTPATPTQLLTAPSLEFYDPDRLEELRQVERNTYAAYKRMLAAAIGDAALQLNHISKDELAPGEKYFKIISAFRSHEYQEKLRRESPNAGSAGLAVNSPHFTGRALDIYVGGDPVDTRDSNRAIQVNSPAYKWLVRNASRFGFRPYFYEPWHWEYVE